MHTQAKHLARAIMIHSLRLIAKSHARDNRALKKLLHDVQRNFDLRKILECLQHHNIHAGRHLEFQYRLRLSTEIFVCVCV